MLKTSISVAKIMNRYKTHRKLTTFAKNEKSSKLQKFSIPQRWKNIEAHVSISNKMNDIRRAKANLMQETSEQLLGDLSGFSSQLLLDHLAVDDDHWELALIGAAGVDGGLSLEKPCNLGMRFVMRPRTKHRRRRRRLSAVVITMSNSFVYNAGEPIADKRVAVDPEQVLEGREAIEDLGRR